MAATAIKLPADLVRLARRLTRLQVTRRRYMRDLRVNAAEIKTVKRELKALANSMAKPDPFDQVPAMRFEKEK